MIREILKNPNANILFSFVIGLGVAVLMFHRVRKEFVIPAVDMEELTQAVTKIDGKCYRFRVTDASEPSM
jgi:hypothetical protein